MRILFAFFAALFLFGSASLPAQADDAVAPPIATTREARLDQLFVDLKRERNEKAAERIAARISHE
ncbi:MAG: hypothetical protein E5V21_22565, partial [Mesorhizobium sp.]